VTVLGKHARRQTDAELVVEARQSEAASGNAFSELVHRYQRMAYALALSLVPRDDVDDVVQEAFLRAFRNLDLLADPTRFGVWLRRITFGVAIDYVRADRSRSARLIVSDPNAQGGVATPSIEPTDVDLSPLGQLEQNEVVERVLAALDRMPAKYRVPLALYHIDGLTHAKVARTLGVPESTVRSLVARARAKLARLLADTPEAQDMTDGSPSLRHSTDVLDDSIAPPPRFLHVLNGDSVRVTLERSDVPGAFAVYGDILHEGPVPFETGTGTWRETRARYVAGSGYLPYADAIRITNEWDAKLDAFRHYDEVVMWFEHDLYDQLLLIRHLDWFSRRDLGRTTLSLICIGEFPGFEPFHGLGQLDADQLASLLGTREEVSREQLALGRRAWEAFTAGDPSELDALAHSAPGVLPFLPGALRRFIEEYPATGTGLPRTERHILEILGREPRSPAELFGALQACEERVFMGDTTFWVRVRRMGTGEAPLVAGDLRPWDDNDALPDGTITITDVGRDVLAGRADWIRLNGFDRWLGGVHLSTPVGGDVQWRYDPRSSHLVSRPSL